MIKKIVLSITISTSLFATENYVSRIFVEKKDGTKFTIEKYSDKPCNQMNALVAFKQFSCRCTTNFDLSLDIKLFLGHSNADIVECNTESVTRDCFDSNVTQFPRSGHVYFIGTIPSFSKNGELYKEYRLLQFTSLSPDWRNSLLYRMFKWDQKNTNATEEVIVQTSEFPALEFPTKITKLTGIPYKCIQYNLSTKDKNALLRTLKNLFLF